MVSIPVLCDHITVHSAIVDYMQYVLHLLLYCFWQLVAYLDLVWSSWIWFGPVGSGLVQLGLVWFSWLLILYGLPYKMFKYFIKAKIKQNGLADNENCYDVKNVSCWNNLLWICVEDCRIICSELKTTLMYSVVFWMVSTWSWFKKGLNMGTF